jgi:hypothetical protein
MSGDKWRLVVSFVGGNPLELLFDSLSEAQKTLELLANGSAQDGIVAWRGVESFLVQTKHMTHATLVNEDKAGDAPVTIL